MKKNLIDIFWNRVDYFLNNLLYFIRIFLLKKTEYYKFGSTKLLESEEKLCGGSSINIARRKVSKYDPRSSKILNTGDISDLKMYDNLCLSKSKFINNPQIK